MGRFQENLARLDAQIERRSRKPRQQKRDPRQSTTPDVQSGVGALLDTARRSPLRDPFGTLESYPSNAEEANELQMGEEAERVGAIRQLERDVMDRSAPMGLGYVARPFVNAALDPERRESIGRAAEGFRDWALSDQPILPPEWFDEDAPLASEALEAAPGAIARLPGQVARGAEEFASEAPGAIAQGFDWFANDPAPREFVMGLPRALTYGPWENEREAQRALDEARARGDEEGADSAADAANLETLFGGMNLAFAPADAVGVAGMIRGARNEATESIARRLPDDAPMGFEGAPRTGEVIDVEAMPAPSEEGAIALRSLRTPEERAEWAPEAVVHLPADGSGGYDVYAFRGPQDSQMVVKIEDVAPSRVAGNILAVDPSANVSGGGSRAVVSFEDLTRSSNHEPYSAQSRFSPAEARQILNRVVATIEEDARINGRETYVLQPASPEHARVYAAMARTMPAPSGYRVEPGAEGSIRIVRDSNISVLQPSRLETVGEGEMLPEAIRRMPLLEAGAIGAGTGLGIAALQPGEAEADDGEGGEGSDWLMPALGAAAGGAAGLIALRGRGRGARAADDLAEGEIRAEEPAPIQANDASNRQGAYSPTDEAGNPVASDAFPFGFRRLGSGYRAEQFMPREPQFEWPDEGVSIKGMRRSRESVPIADLSATQLRVGDDFLVSGRPRNPTMMDGRRSPFGDAPAVVRIGDDLFVIDGHNRIAEAAARGETAITAHVFDGRRLLPRSRPPSPRPEASQGRMGESASSASDGNASLPPNGGDPANALAPLAITGAGLGAIGLAGEAEAQDYDPLAGLELDPDSAPPSAATQVGAPSVYGDIYVREYSDGSRHVFRVNREGRYGEEYLGRITGTNFPSAPVGDGDRRTVPTDVYGDEPDDVGEDFEFPERPFGARIAAAGAGGLIGRLITPRQLGAVRAVNTGLGAGLGDWAAGGDPTEALFAGAIGTAAPALVRRAREDWLERAPVGGDMVRGYETGRTIVPRDAGIGYDLERGAFDELPPPVTLDERGLFGQELQLESARRAINDLRERNPAVRATEPPDGAIGQFVDPGSGRSLFGEPPRPRGPRPPLPPLDERAAEAGAQGAMRGVSAGAMREMAEDLGIATDGVKAGDLRRTLVRELGRRFDSTRELVAFLQRYGVSAAALGIGVGALGADQPMSAPVVQ